MDQLIQQVGSFFGGIVGNPIVQLTSQVVAVYVVVIWLAASYWAFRDMQLRTENPVLPYVAAAFIIVFSPVAFVAAVIVYRIVRPQEKIGEVFERTLAEEALLAEVESVSSCPACARRVNDEWILCPTCRTRLKRVCPNCSRLVGLDWSLCAWCGRDFERREAPAALAPAVTDVSVGRSIPRGAMPEIAPDPLAVPPSTRVRPARPIRPANPTRSSSDPLPER
ncbi:MAG: zinc ribbon domain-containing protein [Chloroflexi bacterium]|nr:zinc ribbon domain-containing protein [Chloroflexota bacterium]